MQTVSRFSTPQLECVHRGKVRDSFRIDATTRLIVATDRLSAFDRVLDCCIPGKGAALTRLASFWFERTHDRVPHHWIRTIGERAMLVREARPILLEMVVRAYLTGSAWRAYAAGARSLSGVKLPEGLAKNERLAAPIVTPTTKAARDEPVTPQEIVERGIASRDVYRRLEEASLALFDDGSRYLREKGVLLVDTKYEFGLIDDRVVLIDEMHTPDSSRFWLAEEYDRNPAGVEGWDKEIVRAWLLAEESKGRRPTSLPDDVISETARRYREICDRITGETPAVEGCSVSGGGDRDLLRALVDAGLLRDGFVAIVMGSPKDREHAERIAAELRPYGVAVLLRVASAHRTPDRVASLAAELDEAREPGAIIAVAGLSNGLGGALAANVTLPVINCPPFRDGAEAKLHLNSSLFMPPRVPAVTVLGAENAAQAALRALALPRVREELRRGIEANRKRVDEADVACRAEGRSAGGGEVGS
ncbi:MAG: phosphoribosylaminoimidazolesuccinocarboxamide synthase [Candidatus Bipolaricaulota bacterium]|nr:phosphoribosylaminoimidazolesuccinocarboxamide synthase [Candidatus Bipolaricaulota bacterium]